MRHRCGPHCGCVKTIVHPTKECVVNNCTKSVVKHVHPSHTTVMNHHLVENVHVFPHSTSVANTQNSVNVYGGSFNVPRPPGQVAGAMAPGMGPGMGPGAGPGGMFPGMGPGMGPGQVAGVMQPGMGPGQVAGAMQPGMGQWNQPNKWC